MRIREIMTTDVETIGADEPAEHALDRMKANHIHHLVVTRGRHIIGVVSSGDLGEGKLSAAWRGLNVDDVMTPDPLCAEPEMLVQKAANLLRGRSIGSLPVMEGGRLVGMVTLSDLLELIGRGPAPKPSGRADRSYHRKRSRPALRHAEKH